MKNNSVYIEFPHLIEGRLLRRYKRFLVDVELNSGELITAHTPNTGAMLDCSEAGRPVYLSRSTNVNRKYAHSLEMIAMPDGLVGLNTTLPNRLGAMAFRAGVVEGFPSPSKVECEVRTGLSRLDVKLTAPDGEVVWVEIKSSTLVSNGVALFPDAVSNRGTRHLKELMDLVKPGQRSLIMVLVQRSGAQAFSPADSIDPVWGKTLREAVGMGVELKVYNVELSLTKATFGQEIKALL